MSPAMRLLGRRELLAGGLAVVGCGAAGIGSTRALEQTATPGPAGAEEYRDGLTDLGPVLRHGDGPDGCDRYGAREAIVYSDAATPGRWWLHYDGAGDAGWLACAASSDDGGRSWAK